MSSVSRRRVLALFGAFSASALALTLSHAWHRPAVSVHRVDGDYVILNGWVLTAHDLTADDGDT